MIAKGKGTDRCDISFSLGEEKGRRHQSNGMQLKKKSD
jgi:hypothetical protein